MYTGIFLIRLTYDLYRIAIIALLLAFKYYSEKEDLISNSNFAMLTGVNKYEILDMELLFFSLLNYDTYVSEKDFTKYEQNIESLI